MAVPANFMNSVGIPTAVPQAFQRKREAFLTGGGDATGAACTSVSLTMKPRQWLPSALNTSNEGIIRLLNPIILHW